MVDMKSSFLERIVDARAARNVIVNLEETVTEIHKLLLGNAELETARISKIFAEVLF